MTTTVAADDRIRPGRGKATPNRSLERGIAILRAFRAGSSMLSNSEIAERTGLSRSTVSRLTQSLIETGMLEYVPAQRAYRLGAPVLSMAHAMRDGSPVLRVAAPMMIELATRLKVNVGLAVADGDEMVYLESFRYNRRPSLRTVVTGQRVPMELTSLGRAYLAAASPARARQLMAGFARRRRANWPTLRDEIEASMDSVRRCGYCVVSWQPQVVALATPLTVEGYPTHVLNVSVSAATAAAEVEAALAAPLTGLATRVREALLRLR